ncbi:MAG: hypothetical protein NTU44_09755 [Bacteroidetes bacterium]|nr:hypothetical protein [Bacteroidota bacterium]
MKKLLLVLFAASMLMGVSCKKDKDESNKTLFPLKVGNVWNFRELMNDSVIGTHFNKVLKDTNMFSNEQWFVVTYDNTTNLYMKIKNDGLWFAMNDTNMVLKPVLFYKYPATINEQYQPTSGVTVTVLSTSVNVTVPAGTFNCYEYEVVYGIDAVYDEYYCPGVGLVKIANNGIAQTVTELTSYTLK